MYMTGSKTGSYSHPSLNSDVSPHGVKIWRPLGERVWITNPLPQHRHPNRITQHNKLHKIIKLITTLNPCLMHSAQLMCAGIHCHIHTHKRE